MGRCWEGSGKAVGRCWEGVVNTVGTLCSTNTVPLNAGNYRSSLLDATQARKVKPGHMKALIRGALACVQLERFGEALQWCDEGLRVRGVREDGIEGERGEGRWD